MTNWINNTSFNQAFILTVSYWGKTIVFIISLFIVQLNINEWNPVLLFPPSLFQFNMNNKLNKWEIDIIL